MTNNLTPFNFKISFLGLLFAMFGGNLLASDWVRLSVLNDRILVLQFDDGYIEHSGYRQGQNTTVTYNFPLDVSKTSVLESYKISSSDDPEFAGGISPIKISRKTKGKDFSNDCNWVNNVCDNDYINEHFIYLHLPFQLKQGFTYTIELDQLAENYNKDSFVFDFTKIRSEAVHANQIGFKSTAPVKYAYLSHWMGDGGPIDLDPYSGADFYLIDQKSGERVFQGNIQKRLDLENAGYIDLQRTPQQGFLSMSDVWECDFSDFKVSGEYVLAIEGIGSSFPFRLDEDIYREPYYHAIRQLYHQRSGIPLERQYTDWTRPRNLHPDDRQVRFQYTTSRWMDWLSTSPENGRKEDVYAKLLPDFKLETWGWYMDAGDWDGYYNHLKIPRFLMTAFELVPENFIDGELNIPESGNGIPDILDEARFLIDYLDRTRGPNGGIAGARIHPDFETKPVNNIPSWEDVRVWTISGEDHVTTFTFSGLSAQLAFCYRMLGMEEMSGEMLEKAVQAYEWATENFDTAVDYHHNSRMYAAAWLYKLTGEKAYQDTYIADFNTPSTLRYADDNKDFAIWAYLTDTNEDIDPNARQSSLDFAVQRTISEYILTAENRSFRVGFGPNFRTFLGQATTPLVFPALVLYHITGEERYYRAALTSADYVLGGNPLDMTWMVGSGHQSPQQILHLDTWLHPDGRQEFIPGTIPYGPTSHGDGWTP
ncbi:glycoside hydrolase family 9 protein, partial [Aquiflexum sp.]|uniref:glycoside hydrolase family 9 protein n=1 Tax=Aquiflexum sp. TaxID=1872584 RepID=UPI0035930DB4